jgi:hypothetical protein
MLCELDIVPIQTLTNHCLSPLQGLPLVLFVTRHLFVSLP